MFKKFSRTTKVLTSLVVLVGGFEGLRTYAYRDPVGIPTICFGETRGVKMGDKKSVEECKDMLANRLIEFDREISNPRCLRDAAAIPDDSYIAFVSLAYNIGSGAFCRSTLARKANTGQLAGACREILRWDKAQGIRLPGLVKRRKAEHDLCMKGVASR